MIRDIQNVGDDAIFIKRIIKQKLINDPDILEALNNPDIDEDSTDEYLRQNIFGFLRIPKTQDTVRNFICFTVDDIEADRYNEVIKKQYIQFTVISHLDDIQTKYGMYRHDLLGYLIEDLFNWTNDFGLQFKLIYNKESTIDADYYCRSLRFEAEKVNNLNKGKMNNPNDRFNARR